MVNKTTNKMIKIRHKIRHKNSVSLLVFGGS
jgi:hypothetical protein